MGLPKFTPNLIIVQVDENCILLSYYTAGRGNLLPTFRDKLLIPSTGAKNPRSQELPRRARISTGTISESFGQCLGKIPGKHEVKELQKTAILDTAHTYILRKVLMWKQKMFIVGNNNTSDMYCNYTILTKLYNLEIWLVSGIKL